MTNNIKYCGATCQKQHWALHKPACRSSLSKKSWKPDRGYGSTLIRPSLGARSYHSHANFAAKYLWGNMPALDIIKLAQHEGFEYMGKLSIAFAACGDPRNVFETICALPFHLTKPLTIFANDKDIDVTLRNALMFLLLTHEDVYYAVDCVLHVWYSSRLKPEHAALLETLVKPIVADVVSKTQHKKNDILLSKRVKFGAGTIRILLKRLEWQFFLQVLNRRLDSKAAAESRKAIVLERKDHINRHLYTFRSQPHRRLAVTQFRERGLLLPFGHGDADFTITNPTFYEDGGLWLQHDAADPLLGWSWSEIKASTKSLRIPPNDMYGSLHSHVRQKLTRAYSTIRVSPVMMTVSCVNATRLEEVCEGQRFDRIDVSNIADTHFLGTPATLSSMAGLLNRDNAHATLITLYQNAVAEVAGERVNHNVGLRERIELVYKYTGMAIPPPRDSLTADVIRVTSCLGMIGPFDDYFEQYKTKMGFEQAAATAGVVAKEENTVTKKWPTQLTLRPGQAGAEEEFEQLETSTHLGNEVYVEWKLQ